MRIILPLLLLLTLGLPSQAGTTETLYDELGAQPGVARFVGSALTLYFNDPRLKPDFDNINRAWLEPHFVIFMCHITDGPCVYKGRSMAAAHKGLHINQAHFDAAVEDLETAMDQSGIPYRTQNRLLARLAPLERSIVTR